MALQSRSGPSHENLARGATGAQPLLFGFGTDGAEQNFLPWLAQNVSAVFTILLSIVLIGLLAALLYALWRELRRNTIVLDPLEVPRELVERGYSPAVVTERLLNAIHTIQGVANTQKPRRGHIASALQADIQIPVGQLSIKALARYFRQLLDLPDQHVVGEITRDGDALTLMLRRRDGAQMTLARPRSATDVAPLITAGAEEAVRLTDPYVLASYYIEQELPGPEFPKTSEALLHVIDTRPDEAPWARNLQGLLLLNRYDNDAALDALRRGYEADPELQSPVSEEFMTALIRMGRTAEALRIVDAATAKRLTAAQRTRIGWCNIMLGRHRIALRHFRRVLAIHREHAYAMLGQAVCLERLHRPLDALPVLEKFFRVRGPGWTGVQVYVGALLDVGRTDDAIRAAEDLYARYPDESAAMATLARIRLLQGRHAEAATLAEAGTRRWAMRALSWHCWGEALLALGDPEAAIAKFRQLYLQEFPSPECVTGWARALLQLGRNDEALAKFAEAEKIDPENARNYFAWGRALKALARAGEGDALIAMAQALAAKQGIKL
ncbi:MAG: tetratricopeptide repeat protein [Casimicrobiaceae bacterium]